MINLFLERNGQTIHVVDTECLSAEYPHLLDMANMFFKVNESGTVLVSTSLTFGAMATFVLGDASFDYGMPMFFWNSCPDWRDHVWLYPEGSALGEPFNVVRAFKNAIMDEIYYNAIKKAVDA